MSSADPLFLRRVIAVTAFASSSLNPHCSIMCLLTLLGCRELMPHLVHLHSVFFGPCTVLRCAWRLLSWANVWSQSKITRIEYIMKNKPLRGQVNSCFSSCCCLMCLVRLSA
jgi:hypothetical protein